MAAIDLFNPFAFSKPYKGFGSLPFGNYEVISFKLIRNRFFIPDILNSARRILMAELHDQVLFLLAYMALNFNDDDDLVDLVNNDGIKRYLCFEGRRPDK